MNPFAWFAESLLDLIYPERCSLCGAEHEEEAWAPRAHRVAGLRFWDGTHLCLNCFSGLDADCVTGRVGEGSADGLQVAAAASTNPDLVKLVGQFKYHGVRGLAWPLASMLQAPLAMARDLWGEVDALVPVSLHARRRRVRGFNQAEILTRLLAGVSDTPVLTDVLVRHRNTGQQAKISASDERRRNLASSFRVRAPNTPGEGFQADGARIGLVDDLVTSGWTVAAAAERLKAAGWDVRWVLALGLAAETKKSGHLVDTWKGGF